MKERAVAHVLVTRGDDGVTLYTGGKRIDIPPSTVVGARDTTGAGDLLVALLLSRLYRGERMETAVRSAMEAVEERLGKGAL